MANYAETNRNALQYAMTDLMNMPEFKRKEDSVIKMLLGNGQTIVSSKERARMNSIKTTDQDTVEISILTKPTTNAITKRSYTHSGNIGDSKKVTLSFITRGQKFKYSVKQADRDSVFSLDQMKAKLLLGHIGLTLDNIESYYLSWLNTNKTQVARTPSLGTWDGTNYIYKVASDDASVFFQRVKGFMRENYYKGQMQMIANEAIAQRAEFLTMQGGANATNLGWQLSGISLYPTTELANDSGYLGMAYVMPVGTLGLEQWIPNMNKTSFGSPFQAGGMYYSIPDPYGSGLVFAVHEIASGADNDGAAGEAQDIDIDVEISVDTAPVKAFTSTPNESTIFKTGLEV